MRSTFKTAVAFTALTAIAAPVLASEVNVYSSRHYDSDDILYDTFTEQTGITVNRVEAKADELIARMEAEGANSPADVLLTVDVGRMDRAEAQGLLQSYTSDIIEDRIPDTMEHPDNLWFGVSQRARIIFYAKDRVENPPQTYEALADPAYKGQICIRTSFNIYNQSLMASVIHTHGEEAAKTWAAGIRDNLAREPQGGDTDQLRGIVSGECDIAVANQYYFARALSKDVKGLTGSTDGIGWVWPNQEDRGTHVNLTTAAMLSNSPNPENALALMEFLTSDFAQNHFSAQNNEYPAVEGVAVTEHVESMGEFKADTTTPTSVFSSNAGKAQAIFNEVNWD